MPFTYPRSFTALLQQPLVPVLNPSRTRLITLGLYLVIVNAMLHWMWFVHSSDVYEQVLLRAASVIGAIPLIFLKPSDIQNSKIARNYIIGYFTYAGPVVFLWHFIHNGNSPVWTTSVSMMCLLLYHVTDWRIATAGIAAALVGTSVMAEFCGTMLGASSSLTTILLEMSSREINTVNDVHPTAVHDGWIAFFFSWLTGLMLGVSSESHRMNRLDAELRAMGIMAHELRTPLASASLLADAIKHSSTLEETREISSRLTMVVTSMNHQIDSQIANAQLLHLKAGDDQIGARALAQNAIDSFPFQTTRERMSVSLDTQKDFVFAGNPRLFTQVIQNLVKNAIFAIKRDRSVLVPGDIKIRISKKGKTGRIEIIDRGPGVPDRISRILFQPFVSSSGKHSSGLGLTFCKNIVNIHGGRIGHERTAEGTVFYFELPIDERDVGPCSQTSGFQSTI